MTDKKDPDKDIQKDNAPTEDGKNTHDPSRRRFIKNTGMVAGGVVGGSLLGGVLTNKFTTKPETQTKNKSATKFQEARQFFSRFEDFVVLQAATERIYPTQLLEQ